MVRLLHVTVYEGAGLAMHKEPYVCAELLNITGRPIKSERAKTPVAPRSDSQNVIWNDKRASTRRIDGSCIGGGSGDGGGGGGNSESKHENEDGGEALVNAGVTLTLGRKHDLRNVGALPVLRLSLWGREKYSKDKPLGLVLVDLTSLPQDGAPVVSWQVLEPATGMNTGLPCGSLKVSVSLEAAEANRIFSASAAGPSGENQGFIVGLEDGPGDEEEQYAELEPNFLVVKVKQAKGLVGLDVDLVGENSSDSFAVLTCDGVEHRTQVVDKDLSPVWDETFEFSVKDYSRVLNVAVMDRDVIVDEIIGSFTINLEDMLHKKRVTRWFQLLENDEVFDPETPLGEVELSIQWIHDPRAKDIASKKMSLLEIVQRTLGFYDGSSDTEEDEDSEKLKKKSAKKLSKSKGKLILDKELKKKEADKKALEAELTNIEVKSGDYMIYVHIIEARDLKAEDVQGTSDPVVYIEAFGKKFATEVKEACLSCVFDETFIIALRNLDKDEFEEGVIRVSVMDADGPMGVKNDLIGSYSFDAANVYFHKDHEIHRQWVALVDDENPKDSGTQGFLQLSIAIVGPGDKLKVHDEQEDRRKEREAEANSGGIDGLVMVPPSVKTKTQWLVTTVWKADYLPVMDTGPIGRAGGDFFATVSVSGGAPATSKRKHMYGGRANMCPAWRTQLWVPASTPCMSGSIKTVVKDSDSLADEVVACVNVKLKDIERMPDRRHAPRWFPLYGPPLVIPTSSELADVVNRTMGTEAQTNWRSMYENLPQKASTYRGRILLSREIRESLPAGSKESTPWRRKVARLQRKKEPSTSRLAMRCCVVSGADIPQTSSVLRMGLNFKMSVKVTLGSNVLETRMVENENGVCEWGELLESKDPMVLPSDAEQIPDVMVHLQRGDEKLPICFCRIPAKEFLNQKMRDASPRWLLLSEDKVLDCLPPGQYPGSVLIKLGLGTLRDFTESDADWRHEAFQLRKLTSYLLRVHVYQGRDLPPADPNGLMDPYLKMQCKGEQLNTETFMYMGNAVHRRRETVDPMWYFTWEADLELPMKELQKYFPQVSVQLIDFDAFGVDDYAGCLFLNLGECLIERDQRNIPKPKLPTWTPFFLEKPGDSSGELLVSFQLIEKTKAKLTRAPPPDLSPTLRPAHLEVLALGIRGMQPYEMVQMQMPYMTVEVDLPHGRKVSLTTNPSKKPSGADANFLERLTMPIDLPEKEIFAPRLKLRVHDVRLGGFLTPVVAVGAVNLDKKLPWSSTFEPPSSQTIDTMGIMGASGAPIFGGMFDNNRDQQLPPLTTQTLLPGSMATTAMTTTNPSAVTGGGAGGAMAGGGALLGQVPSYGLSGASTEAHTTNPLFGGGGGTGRGIGTAAISQDPPPTAALGNGVSAAGVLGGGGLPPPPPPEVKIVEVMGQEDEGAGVFGALLHEPVVQEKVWSAVREAKSGKSQDEDEEDGPPKYMIGRETVESELERSLGATPFETFDLYRGQKFGGDEGNGNYRKVGIFKCIIRVTIGHPDDEPMFAAGDKKRNEEILNELLLPKGYKVRLYVLRALNLTPMDLGIGGRPGKSDPYVRVKLGKETFNDQENYIDDVTDADIYKCIELNCELPGASQLEVNIDDYDDIGGDELIGRTVIDLEDRWFDQRWQALGIEHRKEDSSDPSKMRWQVKPIENRSLYVHTSNAPQGILQCWVDIMLPGDAKGFTADDIALPPDEEFEVRLVVWKCKDVVSMDLASGLNDLFVKAWLEGCDPQVTDTHWRAQGGKGSFNWRMKFKAFLGPRARTSKFPYLTLQMWDKDILKWNDCIAEGMLDLGKHFRKACKKKIDVLKLFESAQTEKAKEAIVKTQQALASDQAKALRLELETGIINPLLGDPAETNPNANPNSPASSLSDDVRVGLGGAPGGDRAPAEDLNERKSGRGGFCGFCQKKPMTPLELREENDRRRTVGMPLLDEDEGLTRKEAKKKRKEEGDEEVQELIKKIKVMAGVSSDDPPDTKWIKLEKTDKKTGKTQPMGQCLIGIQIFPIEKSEAQPAGIGRTEPNDSPFLPPPNGRLKFGWNPFSIIAQLLGPRLCCILCCCILIALIVVSLIVLQPLWNLAIALAFK